ncbi:MAG: DNA polymerase I [Patescibacteria group bacterium]|mgnify:CR=1 FL=1
MKKTLIILDTHALIHRSYHAIPSFTSPSGEPMGAVYGVSAVLLKLVRELKPTHLAAAFDREEPTFRHVAYENYKATRQETKSDLVPQFDKTKELFRALGVPMFEVAGFEADDIIGTLIERFRKEKDISMIIASGDMDTLQLVEKKKVQVYTLRKGIDDTILYDEDKVNERFGFSPEHVIDFKGLKGDPSDNIIGVKGIGEKTATQLILHYGSIEEMYEKLKKEKKHPTWLKDRIVTLLLENEEEALFSKELATIRRDAPVTPTLDELVFAGIPTEQAATIFRKFHFQSLISRLPKEEGQQGTLLKEPEEILVGSIEEIERLSALKDKMVVWSSEENISFSVGEKEVLYPRSEVTVNRERFNSIFQRRLDTVTDDAKSLFHIFGFSFPIAFDIKIALWILNPEERRFSLEDTIRDHLPSNIINAADGVRMLEGKFRARLEKESLASVYFSLELPLIPILYMLERQGILVDALHLGKLKKVIEKEIGALEKNIWKHAGEHFDISSPKQLGVILFERLGLSTKGIKKTSTKSISTQASELIKLREAHPIIEEILTYRELSKISSTYVEVLPTMIGQDGRVHTTFHQTGTTTGRLSSSDPNLQNIPIRTELGRDVRRAFIAEQGFELVSFDYSQLELRIAAALSGDKKLIAAFQAHEDIHTRTAAEIFHVEAGEVTKEMRRRAKTINFGILYGMGARALAQGMKVSFDEADKYLKEYLREFQGIQTYRERIVEEGSKEGFVSTLFGRKRYLPNLRSRFEYVRAEAERMAMNAPIQGTEADLLKRATIRIFQECGVGENGGSVRMLLQVHDELLFEVREDLLHDTALKVKKIMEDVPELEVPIVVDIKHGKNWQDTTMI